MRLLFAWDGMHFDKLNQLTPACQHALQSQDMLCRARPVPEWHCRASPSARMALHGAPSARMALQGTFSARMTLRGSPGARMALQGSPSSSLTLNPCLAAGVGCGHACRACGDTPQHWLPTEPAGHGQDHSAGMHPVQRIWPAQASTMRQPPWLRYVPSWSRFRRDCCLACTSVYTQAVCVQQ